MGLGWIKLDLKLVGRGELQLAHKQLMNLRFWFLKKGRAPKVAPQCPSWIENFSDARKSLRSPSPTTFAHRIIFAMGPRTELPPLLGLERNQRPKQGQKRAVPYATADLPPSHPAFTASEQTNADPAHRSFFEIPAMRITGIAAPAIRAIAPS